MNTGLTSTQRLLALEIIIINKMDKFSCRDLRDIYKHDLFEVLDWHDFSDFLSYLDNTHVLKLVGVNQLGLCLYSINI